MKGSLRVGLVLCLLAICAGCGDTFRPIITPNPTAFPDPRASHTVVAINNNGTSNPGSIMVVDVSGDTDEGVANLGLVPVHAVQQTANQVLVVNHSVTDAKADSLTKVLFSGVSIASTTTISLPDNSEPTFVAVAPSDTTAYVTLPNVVPDPVNFPDDNAVGAVSTTGNALVATIRVGNCPVAIAVTPDKNNLYVANNSFACNPEASGGSISAFNTLDRSPRPIDPNGFPVPFVAPVSVSARSDSQRVYVLNGDGTLTTLDTTAQAGTTDKVVAAGLPVGPGASMLYDVIRNRIYVPSGKQITIVDVSQDPPRILGNSGNPLPIDTVPPDSRNPEDLCSSSTAKDVTAVAVAALPDGSRVYVGSFYTDDAGNLCPQVTVIDASANTVKTNIAVPGIPSFDDFCATTNFRFTMAAGGDSSRVYLASCDGGNVNLIQTSDDTYLLHLSAPASAREPIPPDTQPPPQNPVFLIAGP
jgi:DNA-binding beta-propeller fold protein YncE